jgi:hypothetical protein
MAEIQNSAMQEQKAPRRNLASAFRRWRMQSVKHRPVRPKRNLTVTLREWHKRAGLAVFVFMGWLGFSGVLLNQSASWGLDAVRLGAPWLMSLYGLHAEPPLTGFSTQGHWLAVTADATLLDGKPLSMLIPAPRGFVTGGGSASPTLFVASADSLVLLKPDGSRIDELRSPTLPVSTIRRVGAVDGPGGRIAVQDLDAFQSADEGETWTPVDPAVVHWSGSRALSENERTQLLPFSKPTVALEQVLIDAHSGRLVGRYGPYVINAVGITALWLAISGAWMMWRTSRRRRA